MTEEEAILIVDAHNVLGMYDQEVYEEAQEFLDGLYEKRSKDD